MVTISVAVTAPVNPPSTDDSSTTTILTHDDLWAAMVYKSRYPKEFIPQIAKAWIVREDEKGITRTIVFKKDQGEEEELVEDITYTEKMKISYHIAKTGQSVDNIISYFPTTDATTATPPSSSSSSPPSTSLLHLTFTFEWQHPEVAHGSEAAKQLEQQHIARASFWVPHSVAVARKLKEEGRLQLG